MLPKFSSSSYVTFIVGSNTLVFAANGSHGLQHAWLTRWVVNGEVPPAAQKRKEQEAVKASEERKMFFLASAAAALPLAVLVALRLK